MRKAFAILAVVCVLSGAGLQTVDAGLTGRIYCLWMLDICVGNAERAYQACRRYIEEIQCDADRRWQVMACHREFGYCMRVYGR